MAIRAYLLGCCTSCWLLGVASAADAQSLPAPSNDWSVNLAIRSSITDIPLYQYKNDLLEAEGAQATFSVNELTHQTGLALDGVAALIFRSPTADFGGIALGPYIQGDGTNLFQTRTSPSSQSDTVTFGAFSQFGFGDSDGIPANYIRLRGGFTDGSSGTESANVVGEWFPYNEATRPRPVSQVLPFVGSQLSYQFTPELMLQYDDLTSGPNKFDIFSSRDDALRVGPQVQIKLFFNTAIDLSQGQVPQASFLDKISASLTYHVDVDTFTGRTFFWTQELLSYNLDKDNHFAVSGSYGYGDAEATGNRASQFKIGLAVKL